MAPISMFWVSYRNSSTVVYLHFRLRRRLGRSGEGPLRMVSRYDTIRRHDWNDVQYSPMLYHMGQARFYRLILGEFERYQCGLRCEKRAEERKFIKGVSGRAPKKSFRFIFRILLFFYKKNLVLFTATSASENKDDGPFYFSLMYTSCGQQHCVGLPILPRYISRAIYAVPVRWARFTSLWPLHLLYILADQRDFGRYFGGQFCLWYWKYVAYTFMIGPGVLSIFVRAISFFITFFIISITLSTGSRDTVQIIGEHDLHIAGAASGNFFFFSPTSNWIELDRIGLVGIF
jgi:hypothetical protein